MVQNTSHIIQCTFCGTKNRIDPAKSGRHAKCGKCGAALGKEKNETSSGLDAYVIRCSQCGTKNRIPSHKIEGNPRCGKCGTPLDPAELFHPQPMDITDFDFETKVLRSPLPALVYAWAPW